MRGGGGQSNGVGKLKGELPHFSTFWVGGGWAMDARNRSSPKVRIFCWPLVFGHFSVGFLAIIFYQIIEFRIVFFIIVKDNPASVVREKMIKTHFYHFHEYSMFTSINMPAFRDSHATGRPCQGPGRLGQRRGPGAFPGAARAGELRIRIQTEIATKNVP